MQSAPSSRCKRGRGPDGPWAWLSVSAAAWNLFWLSLLRRSGGVLFVALVTTFQESREATSWVISLNMSLAMLLGPLWGLLTKFLSLRTQTLLGCAIVGASSIVCFFARSLTTVIILQGVCGGIGQGIVMPTKDLLIGYHFRKYRGSANGIYFIGGTLAAFAYPMILLLLIQEYTLGGALLITGGLQLNSLAGSLFYRKPSWAKGQDGRKSTRDSADTPLSGSAKVCQASEDTENPATAKLPKSEKKEASESQMKDNLCGGAPNCDKSVIEEQPNTTKVEAGVGTQQSVYTFSSDCTEIEPLSDKRAQNGVKEVVAAQDEHSAVSRRTKTSRNLDFFKHPVFYMVFISCTFSAFSMVTFTVLVDYVKEKGFSAQDGAILLSVRAIGDAVSRPLSGVLSDRRLVGRRTLMCLSKVTVACACVLIPLAQSYAALLVLCVVLGWSAGTAVVLYVPIMADHLGVKNLGLSMGICRLAMGVGHLTCPMIIGYFKDQLGTYEGIFYLSSTTCLLVASLWFADGIRMALHRKRRRTTAGERHVRAGPANGQKYSSVPS
ncbi:monocarboxylate transporter 9-like isoform X1 [Haemaphysalis longicornis]